MISKRQIIAFGQCLCSFNRRSVKPWKKSTTVPSVTTGARPLSSAQSVIEDEKVQDFSLKQAVLMRKITRYEYEKKWNPHLNKEQLKDHVRNTCIFQKFS